MVTFQELSDLRLGKLKSAVDDWEHMVGELVKIADGGDGDISAADLEKKARSAEWTGHNATVTKQFVTKSAAEFDDVVTAARSVHTILSGALSKFRIQKANLAEAVAKAAKKSIHVDGKGTVRSAVPSPQVIGDAKIEPPTQAEIDAVAEEVRGILEAAAETDRASRASTVLRRPSKTRTNWWNWARRSRASSATSSLSGSTPWLSRTLVIRSSRNA